LNYVPYTNLSDARGGYFARGSGPEFHYLDDDTEPPSDTASHALPLSSFDSDEKPWQIVYFLILEETEATGTLTMKRIGLGVTSTDRGWAQELLSAPSARVSMV
jgi:hypothetical protein